MPPIGLILLVAVAVFLNGIIIFILAIRGRSVPGSLICSGCGFDVLGIPDESVCPECGKSLGVPGAARPRRSRSGIALTTGALLTLLPLLAVGGLIYAKTSSANLYPYAPVWLLMIEAEQGTPSRATASLDELAKRMRSGSLPEPTIASLVATAMRLRTTPNITWNDGWSEIIEQARASGRINDAQWVDYVRYSIVPICLHRKAIRRGAELPISLTIFGTQLGPGSAARVVVRHGIDRLTLSGHEVVMNDFAHSQVTLRRSGTSRIGQLVRVGLPEGEHKSVATYRFEVLDPSDTNRVLGSWTQDFDNILEIAKPDAGVVSGISDDSLADKIRKALTVAQVDLGKDRFLSAMIYCRDAPVPLAFEVFARLADGSEPGTKLSLGIVYFSKGGSSGFSAGGFANSLDATSVDLIFTPSTSAAEQTIDMNSVWIGPDIVIPNVPIQKAGGR